jgi:hypothetical protein
MFETSCRDEAVMNAAFATTKWSEVTKEAGREADLKEPPGRKMLDHDATMPRFEDTKESARAIIDHRCIIVQIIKIVPIDALLIQGELVSLQRKLPETSAAKPLESC